jgi:hypothetical protein
MIKAMTFNRKIKKFLSLILLQIFIFLTWFALENKNLSSPKAETILIRASLSNQPKLIKDNGIYLLYSFSYSGNFGVEKDVDKIKSDNNEIYAILRPKDKYYILKSFVYDSLRELKDGEVAIKGLIQSDGRIEYGIEEYFISPKMKKPIKRVDKIEVLIDVDQNHKAKINSLIINDKPFKEVPIQN